MFKKIAGFVVSVPVLAGVMVGNAMAALPAGVEAGYTAIGTDATTLAGYAGTAVMIVLGFTIGLKLTKRFANKV